MLVAAALLFANSVSAVATPARAGGVEVAAAQVSVEILRPAVVRQQGGWERGSDDGPHPQITLRNGEILIEFQ